MTTQTRYTPPDSKPVTSEGVDAVVYVYENNVGKLVALGYAGRSNKHRFHYSFKSIEQRDLFIADFFRKVKERDEHRAQVKAERSATRKAFRHGYEVGDVLYSSWGYDQTNVDFYQVIATTAKTVTFREIRAEYEGTGYQSGRVKPRVDQFIESALPHTRVVSPGSKADDKGTVKFATHKGGYQRHLWYHTPGTDHYTSDGH